MRSSWSLVLTGGFVPVVAMSHAVQARALYERYRGR
jgi:hypothetical protein